MIDKLLQPGHASKGVERLDQLRFHNEILCPQNRQQDVLKLQVNKFRKFSLSFDSWSFLHLLESYLLVARQFQLQRGVHRFTTAVAVSWGNISTKEQLASAFDFLNLSEGFFFYILAKMSILQKISVFDSKGKKLWNKLTRIRRRLPLHLTGIQFRPAETP